MRRFSSFSLSAAVLPNRLIRLQIEQTPGIVGIHQRAGGIQEGTEEFFEFHLRQELRDLQRVLQVEDQIILRVRHRLTLFPGDRTLQLR